MSKLPRYVLSFFFSRPIAHTHILSIYLQALQRISEWRYNFGSTAIWALHHWFDDQSEYRSSDTNRAEWAAAVLSDSRFIYRDPPGGDTVCLAFAVKVYTNISVVTGWRVIPERSHSTHTRNPPLFSEGCPMGKRFDLTFPQTTSLRRYGNGSNSGKHNCI